MHQIKRFIDMEQSVCFCFYQLGLCSDSYTANEYSIYHFCIMIKDFSISLSKVSVVQDIETVTFYVISVYNPTFCYFLLNFLKGSEFQVPIPVPFGTVIF